jgi:putative copper export protein
MPPSLLDSKIGIVAIMILLAVVNRYALVPRRKASAEVLASHPSPGPRRGP